MTDLGNLVRVKNAKETFGNEAHEFTPWLAKNLHLLSEALGLGEDGLQLVDTEVPVGAYSADIVCTDTTKDAPETVLIENQYGRSDHDHFGKIITYASGLKASTIVLVCEALREEHRTAMTWLNSITEDSHNFFAIELELWRINDSPVAPKLDVVVQPDNWARIVERAKKSEESGKLSELQKLYLQYWGAFREFVSVRNETNNAVSLRPRKPLPQQWTGFSIGRAGAELNASVNSQDQFIRVELTLLGPTAAAWRETLLQERKAIEQELNYPLEWEELGGVVQAIRLHKRNVDPTDKNNWHDQHTWLDGKLRDLFKVFHSRVNRLP